MNSIHRAVLRGFINLGYGAACPSVTGAYKGLSCLYDESLSDRLYDRLLDRFYDEPESGTFEGFVFTSEGGR